MFVNKESRHNMELSRFAVCVLCKYSICFFSATSYHISVKTGDLRGAGTDANVHIKVLRSLSFNL